MTTPTLPDLRRIAGKIPPGATGNFDLMECEVFQCVAALPALLDLIDEAGKAALTIEAAEERCSCGEGYHLGNCGCIKTAGNEAYDLLAKLRAFGWEARK